MASASLASQPPNTVPISGSGAKTSTSTSASSSHSGASTPTLQPTGGVVDITISSAIIGTVFTVFVFQILMKRSKHLAGERRRRSRNDNEKRTDSRTEAPLEANLLERADDSQIRKSMQDLHEFIDQHCENHYHDQAVDIAQGCLERARIEAGHDNLSS